MAMVYDCGEYVHLSRMGSNKEVWMGGILSISLKLKFQKGELFFLDVLYFLREPTDFDVSLESIVMGLKVL